MTRNSGLIDVHSHLIPPFYREALIAAGRGPSILGGFPEWTPELALAVMDRHGIATSILSVSQPGTHFGDDGKARALSRTFNEYMAGLIERHAGRIGAFAVTPLPDIDGACAAVAHALDVLKLDGIGLLASYGEMFLGDPNLDPVMQELNSRGAIVFVHPNLHPTTASLGLSLPSWLVEYPFDTSRAAVNLIFSGTLRRFPRIRFILAHAGGTLPYLSWRIAAAPMIDRRFHQLSADDIRADLRSFWYETAQAPGRRAAGNRRSRSHPVRQRLALLCRTRRRGDDR